jgi:hypothetical protein
MFDPERPERFFISPRYHFRLAKLYQQNGQSEKAIRQFEIFLELWKDADPRIIEAIDAGKRLPELKQGHPLPASFTSALQLSK